MLTKFLNSKVVIMTLFFVVMVVSGYTYLKFRIAIEEEGVPAVDESKAKKQ